MVIRLLISAIVVFIAFRIIHFINRHVKSSFKIKNHLNELIPLVESFAWMAFVLWVVKVIYDSKNYYALISISTVFLLLSVPLFYLLRDFVTSVFLKLQNKITEGTYIEIEEIKGIVKEAGHFRMDIEDYHGNISSVSYYKIRSKIISKPGANHNLEKATIEFRFADTIKVNELIDKLKKAVLNTPWVAVSQSPIIESTKHEHEKIIIELGIFMLDKAYIEDVRIAINNYLRQ